MLLQFHLILILVIAAEGMFLPHHGEDDPRTALSFTALLEEDKADHVNWKSEESFIKKPEQERRKSSPREEVLNGEEIVTRKEVQKSDSKSDLLKETPHITLENTAESTRRRITTNINHDSSQSEKDHESSGIEASSSHGTSVGDHAGLFENGHVEDHEKSQKDISLEFLQEPWFYEHDLMGADAMRAESTLMDIDLSKDSDPNSLIATWSSWDTSYNHHQDRLKQSADPGDNLMVHRPSVSPSQSQENPTEMYAHETPVDTSSSLHQTPEVNVLGHKRPFLNEDPEEEMHEAKRLKMFDFNSFPFDLTNSPSQGISSLGIIGGMDHSNQGSQEHVSKTFTDPSYIQSNSGNIEFPHTQQESSFHGDHNGALIDRYDWQQTERPIHWVGGTPNVEGNQNPRWKVPIGSLGPDVDPSTEALLRATVSPSIIVPSKFTKKNTDHNLHNGFIQHFTPQDQVQMSPIIKPPGIPKPPKSLNPSSTGSISGLNLSKVNQKALDISTLNESFSKYLLHVLHQIPNMGFDLNLIKDCILPHSLMVIKSDLDTTRKRKILIILSQVTMYLLDLSPRNKLPGSKGNLKSGIYDDVLQWVNKILLHPDIDQSEIPIMIGVEMRGKRISSVLQSSLSEYLKDSTINFETMKNKEMEYTHLFGAALVDEWLIGYYTDVWRKLTKVTRYEFNPEKMLYKGLLKSSSVEDEFEQKIPLDQMKLKLGLTIRICELIGEDSISKEIESLTNLLIQMNLSSKLLENKRIIKLFLTYQSQLLQSSKENSTSKIFKHLSIEKLMKEFILNVEDLILSEDRPSFISTWLKESLSKFLLTQEDDHQILHFDQHLKLLSFSILTDFFKQISELTVQDPILKSKFQKTLGKFSSE